MNISHEAGLMTVKPDDSLERDERPLAEWLWQLVDESRDRRIAAGEALEAMAWGLPSVHTDWDDLDSLLDTEAQQKRFAAGVREAVDQPDFDTREFVERLVALKLTLSDDQQRWADNAIAAMHKHDERFDRLSERVVTRLKSSTNPEEREEALKRLVRLSTAYICSSCTADVAAESESVLSSGIAAIRIFTALDRQLLAAPESLQILLDNSDLRTQALGALQRIGPPAMGFVPDLLRALDALKVKRKRWIHFDAASALGAIGRDDPEIVDALLRRLDEGNLAVQVGAAQVFEHMGQNACGREEEICSALMARMDEEPFRCATATLASVGGQLPDVRRFVIEMAGARPPVWEPDKHAPDGQFDRTMADRATAIGAMRYLTDHPDECLPVLIDALDTFEEFDPDECYEGPHGRVSYVIGLFGPRAAAATEPLVAHLKDEPDDFPRAIIDALAKIGPAAKAALPALRELHEVQWEDDEPDGDPDRSCDPLGWAIRQIEGR